MKNIQEIKISKLEVNKGQVEGLPKNPRFIRDERYKALVKSIEDAPEMMWLRELIVVEHGNKFVVVGGNMRFRACKELGWKSVPSKVLPADTPPKKLREYARKDNIAFGEDDWDATANEWDAEELQEWGMELPMDWDVDGQGDVTATEDDFDESEVTEAVCKRGEVWKLGEHRLMCGDSTKAEDFEKLMAGEKADLTFTSPPYNGDNASADGDIFVGKGKQRLYADGYSDNLESSEYVKFAESVLAMCFKHTDGFIFWNVNYNSNSKFEYIQQIVKFLPALVEQVCWKKSSAIPFKGCMRRGWEPVYIFSTTGKNLGLKEVETNIWEISNTNSQGADHKACFPVALPAKGISLVPAKSGIVLEPFGGTGTTMIACEQLNRKCRMMELDPHYCDVIIARWEKLTGQKAERISDG
jgi:DNA modification methylase